MQLNRRLCMLTIALSLIMASIGLSATAAKEPGMSYFDANKMLSVSQLKRGMKGYGLTVFQGTKIDKFDVEILGVLKQANKGKDFILVRVAGGPISTRGLGVAHGMSGSPVYINGKLIGAVSAAMNWAKEPIGMVTPIADMLEALDENLPKRATGYSSVSDLEEPAVVEGRTYGKIAIDSPGAGKSDPNDGTLHIKSLGMPLMVSGMSDRAVKELQQILAPYNIVVMQGGGTGGKSVEKANPELVPGAAVGLALATGDIDMTSTGTVTYRYGNKLVAFGHPAMGVGAIDAPMTTAYVVDVLTSYDSSTKLAVPLKTVGRIFQDRPWSVAGAVGNFPKMIPVKVVVNDQTTKRNKTYNMKIINHPLLAPQLAALMVRTAVEQMHSTPGDATANVSYKVTADKLGTLEQSNVFFDQAGIDTVSTSDFTTLMRILSANQFEPLDLKAVDVTVNISDKRNTASIDRVFVKKSEYAPGETVDVGVVLRPYKQERITKTFSVKIPATAQTGKVMLQVRGGGSSADSGTPLTMTMGGDDSPMMAIGSSSGPAGADNVKQLVNKFLERERNNQLVVQLQMPSTAVNIAGEKLTGLPASIADIMKSSKNSGLRLERDEVKSVFDQDMIITGSARLQLDIKQDNVSETKPAASGSPAGGGTSTSVSMGDYDSPASAVMSDYDDMSIARTGKGPSVTVTEKPAEQAPNATKPGPAAPLAAEPKSEEKRPVETPLPAKTDVKTVVRQTQTWSQRTQAELAKGSFSGLAVSSENKLVLTPVMKKMVETPEQFVWSVAPGKTGVYAGTGNSGKIFHVSDNGELRLFSETGELEVHSLVVASNGNVYAGTSPNGKVFKITPDGKSTVVFDADERYVVALAMDDSGNVYAGVGDAGKIYKITPDGASSVYSSTSEQQILSLAWDKQGYLIAGTGINGVVYKIASNGKATPIFDAAEGAISSVTSDANGTVYAGTSPKGVVYKITADGRSKSVFTAAARVLSMVTDPAGNVYAVSDGTLVKITPDETVTQLDSAKDRAQYLALAFSTRTGTLYAGTGNIGAVYASKRGDGSGTYESPVHDTKMISRWGRIKWTAKTPQGTSVELQTRSGNVDTPDATWSEWSRAYTNGSGEQITDKQARYVQYRVTLKSAKADVTPEVSGVTLSYLTQNQQPTVKITEPAGGAVLSGTKSIRWTGSDPDKDKLTYDLFYSKDGVNWTALVGGMVSGKEEKKLTTEDISGKIRSELEKSNDVPQDMKDTILKDQDSSMAAAAESMNKAAGSSSASTSYEWNTKNVEDGTYYIKVVVSDKSSNASGALSNKSVSDAVTVCNTAPDLRLMTTSSIKLKADGPATVTGTAESKMVEISGVQYRVDGGDWMAAEPTDGVFDSSSEQFTLTTDALNAGTHKLEVQTIDAAGNAATENVEIVAP